MQKKAKTDVEEEFVAGMDDTAEDPADKARTSIYEIGYHLLPTLSEDGAGKAGKEIAELLEKNGASPVNEKAPSRIELAYSIQKRVAGKLTNFDEAYFGWTAFEMPRANIDIVKKALDENLSVLRYLVITTSRDAVAAFMNGMTAVANAPTGTIEKPKREAEASVEVSEVALDEALQTIATEDAKVEDAKVGE